MTLPTILLHPVKNSTFQRLFPWTILSPRYHYKEVKLPLPKFWLLMLGLKAKHLLPPQMFLLLPFYQLPRQPLFQPVRLLWDRSDLSEQPVMIPGLGDSLPELGDTHVNVLGAPAYMKAFMVDGEVLPVTDRLRPWRDGRGGKVAKCVGKALLLPEDMKHWVKWDDDTLLLNMKREAIMVINYFLSYFYLKHFANSINLSFTNFGRATNAPWSLRGGF